MIDPTSLGIALGLTLVVGFIRSRKSSKTYEVMPPKTQVVEVEVIDEMTKEMVRNLYEEQDTYNAKISHLIRENKSFQSDIDRIDERIQNNLNEVRTTMTVMPTANFNAVISGCEEANRNLLKHKLRLEGYMINNQEKIVKYKQKSNTVSMKIDKIGREIWKQRQQM